MSPTPDDPTQAQAWISGEAPDQTVDFYIPRGNQGIMGPQGPVGPSLSVGSIETNMGPAAPGTIGPQGLKGDKGDPGGLTAGTPLASLDLNTIIADGVYVQQDGSLPSLARNYPGPGTLPGVMYVHKRTASSILQSYHARFYVSDTNMTSVIYERWSNNTGSSWSPWKPFLPTRIDQTAGRAIYQYDDVNAREQLIWGDTGSRVINDLVHPTNWSAGFTAKLRRVGSSVELRLLGFQAASGLSGALNVFPLALPAGFQNQHSFSPIVVDNLNTVLSSSMPFGGGPYSLLNVVGGRSHSALITWQTSNPWPTTLPGTADGSVPNT